MITSRWRKQTPALLGGLLVAAGAVFGLDTHGGSGGPDLPLEAFERRAALISSLASAGRLSEETAAEAEGVRRSLQQVLDSHDRTVRRLKAMALGATGGEREALLDQLVQAGAEREQAIARHLEHLERIPLEGPFIPPPPARSPADDTREDTAGKPRETGGPEIRLEFKPEDVGASPLE